MELSLIVVKPRTPNVEEFVPLFKARRTEPVLELENVDKAIELAKTGVPCVILISILTEPDILNCLNLIKSISERKDKLRRIIVVSQIQNAKLSNSLLTRGVSDFLPAKTIPSTLVFKIALQLTQIQRLMQQEANETTTVKGSRTGGVENASSTAGGPAFHSSTEVLPEDVWIIKGTNPKKVGVQWVIDIEGPDPDSGVWEPVTDESSREERWAWVPFDPTGKPVLPTARSEDWQFKGNKPVYDPELRKWKFVAAKPDLSHRRGKTKTGSKIKFDPEKGITLAADNPMATERIQESKRIGDRMRQERALLAERTGSATASAPAAAAPATTATPFGESNGPRVARTPALEPLRPPKLPDKVFLQLFFELAEMVNSGQPANEIQDRIVLALMDLLQLESAFILGSPPDGSKRFAQVICTTDVTQTTASLLDLEGTVYKDALTDLKPRYFEAEGWATFPLLNPSQPDQLQGCLVLRYAPPRSLQKEPAVKKLVGLVSKQLSRLTDRPKAA